MVTSLNQLNILLYLLQRKNSVERKGDAQHGIWNQMASLCQCVSWHCPDSPQWLPETKVITPFSLSSKDNYIYLDLTERVS